MAGRGRTPDFIEALARGLDVLRCFDVDHAHMTLTEVATAVGLARPTARRILLTLQELGYVRTERAGYALTPRVLDLGMAYVGALGLWEIARPHLEELVGITGESSSMAQLDGSDIVYVARVAVPKIITLRVQIGTRFPALVTSQGKVLLAALAPEQADEALRIPSRSGLPPVLPRERDEIHDMLAEVRARGWALADEELAPGIRSIAAPVRDGQGRVHAAMNVTVHAAETPVRVLVDDYLPHLLRTAGEIGADWARWQRRPTTEAPTPGGRAPRSRRDRGVA
jgi:IclR family transcriptional regulator, pca regulon regulatory protein